MKVQSNPLAHELSNDISKRGVFEALKQDAPACYAVLGQLESKTQVLFPARNILGDRQIVRLQAKADGPSRIACRKTHESEARCTCGLAAAIQQSGHVKA